MDHETQRSSTPQPGAAPLVETVIRKDAAQSGPNARHAVERSKGGRFALVLWITVPLLITLMLVVFVWLVPVLQTGVEDRGGHIKGQQGPDLSEQKQK